MDERLHKLLAQHGIGSRRQVEGWIVEGRVLVNGKPAVVGQRVGPADRVVVDGRDVTKRIASTPALRVIVYHKPSGEMLKRQQGDERAGVETRLPTLRAGRWLPVSALGYGEDGLLVMTNDGAFAAAAARPGRALPVEYRVRVLRPRETEAWPAIPLTVDVEGEEVEFASVERLEGSATNAWFKVTAGHNVPRGAVRALFDAAGLKVSRIMLVRWGPVTLPRDLPRGRSRDLEREDLDAVLAIAGKSRPRPPRRAIGRRSGGR